VISSITIIQFKRTISLLWFELGLNIFNQREVEVKEIAIIGMGPRGSSLLERCIAFVRDYHLEDKISFLLFNKSGESGSGCHSSNMPSDLLANTVASQMTMYYGDAMESYGPVNDGPCFFDWHTYIKNEPIGRSDYPARKVLGEYLNYFYKQQIDMLNKLNISFIEINEEVQDVAPHGEYSMIKTFSENYLVDMAVLCTGHENMERIEGREIDFILSTNILNNIPHGVHVGVQGMGLTAFDVISRLTEGRGGVFHEKEDGSLKYSPSGNEPTLHLFSRTGVFLSSRAYNSDTSYVYKPSIFNIESINYLRESKGQLDFEADILPLLIAELQIAYKQRGGVGVLDTDMFFNPERNIDYSSVDSFTDSFCRYLRWDYQQAKIGKFCSPYKFCQDVVRDLRDVIRCAVDHHGINSESHSALINLWQPIINKICVGPPYIRLMQLEALINAGVCVVETAVMPLVQKIDTGYMLTQMLGGVENSKQVGYLVKARMPTINYLEREDTLAANLKNRYKCFKNEDFSYGGLEVDNKHRVINLDNTASTTLRAIGLPAEGSKYFTLVLSRPNMMSTFLYDSNLLAKDIISILSPSLASGAN
jgi:hypothetical protein